MSTTMPKKQPQNEAIPFVYGEVHLSCQLSRRAVSSGKVRISVTPRGELRALADAETSLPDVEAALQRRARWIIRTREDFAAQREHALPHRFVDGETHFYLGRRYQLKIVDESEGQRVRLMHGKLVVPSPCLWSSNAEEQAVRSRLTEKRLAAWYAERAREILPAYFIRLLPLAPWASHLPPLRLVNMKQRWGSCTVQGVILLAPQLVRASRACIEYVILHELCHLREHSHSPHFWNLLTQICPDWKARRRELDSMAEIWLGQNTSLQAGA